MAAKLPWKHVHFIGIGGVGMAGLAHILLDCDVVVSGTDAVESEYLHALQLRSSKISTKFYPSMIDDCDLVVYSSAIAENHPEMVYARSHKKQMMRRGALLAEVAQQFQIVIGVAGSHGKTTTAAMLTHVLTQCGVAPGWMVGGCVNALSRTGGFGDGKILVTEVDESDGTQALMHCTHAIITNVEDDHCWAFGGIEGLEECFRTFALQAKYLITWDNSHNRRLFGDHPNCLFADEMKQEKFDLLVPGVYNNLNANLATTIAINYLNLDLPTVYQAIKSFNGVQRRLTERYKSPDNNFILIEDYAHHPTELRATIETISSMLPEHRLIIIFQPHRYERLQYFSQDFAKELSAASATILVPPFSAWSESEEDSKAIEELFNAIETQHGFYSDALDGLPNYLIENGCIDPEVKTVFLLIGAGDITNATQNIANSLKNVYMENCIAHLKNEFVPCEFSNEKTWGELTTLGVGSGHPWIASVQNEDDLEILCTIANEIKLPTRVLGNGTNLVGSDNSSDTLWIKLDGECFHKVSISYHDIIAGAAVTMHQLIKTMIDNDCCPPEIAPLAWIPAQLGGAIRTNAGAHGASISQLLEQFCGLLGDGTLWMQEKSEIHWGNHQATGIIPDMIITSVIMNKGVKGKKEEALEAYQASYQQRQNNQPSGRSAGCIFKNPGNGEYSAGMVIEQAGLRGVHIGNCFVSREHANFLMAQPNTSAKEFTNFVLQIQNRVFAKHNIVLEPEVEFIGEEKYLISKQTKILSYEKNRIG